MVRSKEVGPGHLRPDREKLPNKVPGTSWALTVNPFEGRIPG